MKNLRFWTGWVLLTLTLSAVISLFYFGQYKYVLWPNSTSYIIENTKQVIRQHHDATFLILGDSTAVNAFRINYFNKKMKHDKAVNAAAYGTGLFSAHKLALFAKDRMPRLRNLVLILGPSIFTCDARLQYNMEYTKTSLEFNDAALAWTYFDSPAIFMEGVSSLVFRPVLFGKDMNDIFQEPVTRFSKIRFNYYWLNRKMNLTDEMWEDAKTSNVCNIGKLENLEQTIDAAKKTNNPSEVERLNWIYGAYKPRKGDNNPPIHPAAERHLSSFFDKLSREFDAIYVVNAPIYSGFGEVYSESFLRTIQDRTAALAAQHANVIYIPQRKAFNDDCTNFLDVVHVNTQGGEHFTEYLMSNIGQRSALK